MIKHTPSQPIGIFDSGIGGLTVAHAIVKRLPNENIVYFGDTAHLPYGDKSASAIQAYSIKIAQMLLERQCKLIMIACSSASTAAYELVRDYVATQAIVMNVIDPAVQHLHAHYPNKTIGLIGTRHTVNSSIYQKKIDKLQGGITLSSRATNLLASAIEEFGNSKALDGLLEEYLSHPTLQNVDALVLACTHYPVVKEKIAAFFKQQVEIIDTSDVVATAVKERLEKDHLLNTEGPGSKHFYVSDYTDSFAAGAKLFFNEDITIEHLPLWE